MHCASALRFQFLDRCVPVSPSSSSILIATVFTLPVCPSSLYGGSSYEFWHVGAGSAGCRLVETQHLLRGAHSLHEGEKVFCTAAWKAGHAADRGKSSQMIFLDTLVGKLAAFYYQFDLGIWHSQVSEKDWPKLSYVVIRKPHWLILNLYNW